MTGQVGQGSVYRWKGPVQIIGQFGRYVTGVTERQRDIQTERQIVRDRANTTD